MFKLLKILFKQKTREESHPTNMTRDPYRIKGTPRNIKMKKLPIYPPRREE